MSATVQAAVAKLALLQQERDSLQKSLPAAAHAAITGTPPDTFLQQCFKKAQQQFVRATRAAVSEQHTDAAEVAARITAVKEASGRSVEVGDSAVHLQTAISIVQKHVNG